MLILPALITLLTYLYWRPHEIVDVFRFLTFNSVLAFLAFSYTLDLRLRALQPRRSVLLYLFTAFTLWALLTVAIKAPGTLPAQVIKLMTSLFVIVFICEGLQSLGALRIIGNVLLIFTIAMAALGVDQGLTPGVCYLRASPSVENPIPEGFDGRACAGTEECYRTGLPGAEYACEHAGWLGTHSIVGRVRYRGLLEDPNEMAWVLAMGVPFAFAFYEAKRSARRLLLLGTTLVLAFVCVIMTESRSGQLSLLAVIGVYFIRRFRARGAIAAAIVGLPLLLLGGRSGDEAAASSIERLGCWSEALNMFRGNPLTGVGAGQFLEHHFLTAHNAFLLSLAEVGPVGFLLWTSAIYLAFKITIRVQTDLAGRPEAEPARSWSAALLASFVGLLVSAVFLSITYHVILWIFLGLAGGLEAAVRRHDPKFRVTFGGRDLAFVCTFDVLFVLSIAVYLRSKGI